MEKTGGVSGCLSITRMNSRGEGNTTLENVVFPGSVNVRKITIECDYLSPRSPCTPKLNNLSGEPAAGKMKLGTGSRKGAAGFMLPM